MIRSRHGALATLALVVAPSCAPSPAPGIDERGLALRVPAAWQYDIRAPAATGRAAMVTTDVPLATAVGFDVLRSGGNAIDAAVATAFALAVVYPEAGNIGGGGFLLLRKADGETAALDFRETAPLAATRDMYLDATGAVTDLSVTGHLAAGVPGAVAGLWEAHRRYGSRPWAELLAPAIRLAETGFTIDESFAGSLAEEAHRLERFAPSRDLFMTDGRWLAAGDSWRNPELGEALQRIAEHGPPGFYEGATADLIVTEMRRGGGIITHHDLAAYRARWREPVRFRYRGHDIISMPPPSSGGLTLALLANILEPYELRSWGWHDDTSLHVLTEAMRRAFAERNAFLGDPDFVVVPVDRFLAASHADALRQSISLARATPSRLINPADDEGDHTTHFSVVDAAGNAVALTTTINSLYGSAVVVAGAGFLLNNEMDDFTARPGVPNQFGLVQGAANAIAPGKRMLSAMTPTIVTADGRVVMVTGARGGPRIISAVFQVLSNVLDHGMPVGPAVFVPRVHHQHLPDILYYERGGLPDEVIHALRARGHDVQPRESYIGNAPTIVWRNGSWHGVADPRRGGRAQGY